MQIYDVSRDMCVTCHCRQIACILLYARSVEVLDIGLLIIRIRYRCPKLTTCANVSLVACRFSNSHVDIVHSFIPDVSDLHFH